MESQAAAIYRQIIQNCDDNCSWGAQAARSLGNIYASQTNVAAAVECYSKVGERYPKQEFEVLMAWKSAADLLWDSRRAEDAKAFYQKIVNCYDTADAAAIIKMVVRGARARLESGQPCRLLVQNH
jgi:TolA-binding protein